MSKRASEYATITTPVGLFRPKAMPFGLKNAPYFFCMLMDRVLQNATGFAVPYLDDVAIFSASWQQHCEHLRFVLNKFREANLKVKPSKCQFGRSHVAYLGHIIGQGELRPSEAKIKAVRDFPRPVTKTDVRAFLGLSGYYHRFIPNYAELASPLTDSLRNNQPNLVSWDMEKEKAFLALKERLTRCPILHAPDFAVPFVLQTDCSDRGMGVVLSQITEDAEHPVLFMSRKLSPR